MASRWGRCASGTLWASVVAVGAAAVLHIWSRAMRTRHRNSIRAALSTSPRGPGPSINLYGTGKVKEGTPAFLGLDCSTQSLKALIVDTDQRILYEHSLSFDDRLPSYKTKGGVHHAADGLRVTAPSLMFVEALDILLGDMTEHGVYFTDLRAISGSGQQHGSVYWRTGALEFLMSLDPEQSLREQLEDAFVLAEGPVWMDSSTTEYCRRLENKVGSAQAVADISGSRGYERFTGNQIAKVMRENPEAYKDCERISLISSLLASLFLGDYAPIDAADGSGMNLMSIFSTKWSDALLCGTVGASIAFDPNYVEKQVDGLRNRLGSKVAPSHFVLGTIAPYFVERFGMSSNCSVVAFSGDNPCTIAGLGLDQAGDVAVSMGTSDTLLAIISPPCPSGEEGTIMCNPVDPQSYVAMLCYKNGSLTRQLVRDRVAEKSWDKFNELLNRLPAGNRGQIGIFFEEPEITPVFNYTGTFRFDSENNQVDEFDDVSANVRAVVEGQFLSMLSHARRIGVAQVKRVIATGGGSSNMHILQVLADVFGAPVHTADSGPNAAALGAALRAVHAWYCNEVKQFVPFSEVIKSNLTLRVNPRPELKSMYSTLVHRYQALEKRVIEASGEKAVHQ